MPETSLVKLIQVALSELGVRLFRNNVGALKDKSFGYFVSDDIKEKYHLNFKDNRFGDLIYAVHEGSLIYPNHFQGFNEVKAMHGYGQNLDGEKSVYISNAGKIGAGRLIDFTPFILDRMGLNFL